MKKENVEEVRDRYLSGVGCRSNWGLAEIAGGGGSSNDQDIAVTHVHHLDNPRTVIKDVEDKDRK